ncbi:glycosyltransferase family 2 protein [Candidatus Uhrbacteria bacterium]|jgi:GT2 family glycosyltransferase|nr:glycosyltransferase family 2 protein [Candidatus Uhrbacteria bacterium]
MTKNNMLPKVAIIYLSYNSKPYIDEVFSSLKQLNYPKERLEIIAVDNDSSDGSADIFREMDGITFFGSKDNLGFAAGNNLGINHALLENVDYVYLLNADAKLHSEAILEAVRLAESDEKIGSVQSLMMLWKQPEILNSTGGMVHFLGFGFVKGNGSLWQSDIADGSEITYASGAAVLYRASTLRKVGLLDPFLFLYHEDLELGWRIRLTGQKNVLSTKSIAYHDYEFRRSIKKFYWMERNRILVHFSHLQWKTLLLLTPFLIGLEIGLFVFAIKGGWIKEKLLVYRALLSPSSWKYVARKRVESRAIRSVTDKEIVSLFTGKIAHQETSSFVVDKIANPMLAGVWWGVRKIIRW